MSFRETKTLALTEAEIRVEGDAGEPVRVIGYGSVFGNTDSYGDVVMKGAYSRTIDEWAARGWAMPMLFNHDVDRLLGKWTRMAEDDRGLLLEGELTPNNRLAADIAASLRHGAVSGLSIGFRAIDVDHTKDGTRLLREVRLFETSVVVMPANDLARVGSVKALKGIADDIETLREFERFLRDAGWSRREAEALATGGWKALLTARDERGGASSKAADRRDDGSEANRALVAALKELRGFRLTLS